MDAGPKGIYPGTMGDQETTGKLALEVGKLNLLIGELLTYLALGLAIFALVLAVGYRQMAVVSACWILGAFPLGWTAGRVMASSSRALPHSQRLPRTSY